MNDILKDVAAVQSTEADIIGHLTWYSLGEMLIEPAELRQKMIDSGLGEGWMPKDIRIADAFRRATAIKVRQKISADIIENYMCREVAADKTIVQRNIVFERVDTLGKTLNYDGAAAILILDKKNVQVSFSSTTPKADQLAQEAIIRFHMYCKNYSGNLLRTVVMNILKSMSPTPVRPAGGVYFIPQAFDEQLSALCTFIKSLDKGEAEKVPLINTKDMKNMITRKLHDHLHTTLEACEEGIHGSLPKGQVKEILDDARRVVSDYKQYTAVISGDLQAMESCVEMIKKRVAVMIEKMSPGNG